MHLGSKTAFVPGAALAQQAGSSIDPAPLVSTGETTLGV